METCGSVEWPTLERLLPYLDTILWDLKHVDDEIHRKFTGVSNERTLANLRRLSEIEAPVTIRIPLIPGFNASTESITRIAEYVWRLPGAAKRIDLLPYHTLGKPKYAALQRSYPWEAYQRLTEAEVEALAKIFENYGFQASIGG
jgi:pyruvate formate lyase activating enzyme